MTATGEILGVRMEAIDEALNALAADSDVPAEDYIEALESIAHRCQMAAHAVRLETSTVREWAEFIIELEGWLDTTRTPADRGWQKKAIDYHVHLRRWKDRLTSASDKKKVEALNDRMLREVFDLDPEKVAKT